MIRTAQATKTRETLASELDALIRSASELLENLNEERGDAMEGLRSRASRNIDSARERLATLYPQVKDNATEAARTAARFAERNPWGTAAIGGLVVASLAALVYMSTRD